MSSRYMQKLFFNHVGRNSECTSPTFWRNDVKSRKSAAWNSIKRSPGAKTRFERSEIFLQFKELRTITRVAVAFRIFCTVFYSLIAVHLVSTTPTSIICQWKIPFLWNPCGFSLIFRLVGNQRISKESVLTSKTDILWRISIPSIYNFDHSEIVFTDEEILLLLSLLLLLIFIYSIFSNILDTFSFFQLHLLILHIILLIMSL